MWSGVPGEFIQFILSDVNKNSYRWRSIGSVFKTDRNSYSRHFENGRKLLTQLKKFIACGFYQGKNIYWLRKSKKTSLVQNNPTSFHLF